jgi:hypothetical protein
MNHSIPTGAGDLSLLQRVQIGSGSHPAPYAVIAVFPWGYGSWGVRLATHPINIKTASIHPCAFMACRGTPLVFYVFTFPGFS